MEQKREEWVPYAGVSYTISCLSFNLSQLFIGTYIPETREARAMKFGINKLLIYVQTKSH